MRKKELFDHVEHLVADYWTGPNADVAEVILRDEHAFNALAYVLNNAGDGDPDDITAAFEETARALTDEELDFIVGDPDDEDAPRAERPAAYLAHRVKEVCGE